MNFVSQRFKLNGQMSKLLLGRLKRLYETKHKETG